MYADDHPGASARAAAFFFIFFFNLAVLSIQHFFPPIVKRQIYFSRKS